MSQHVELMAGRVDARLAAQLKRRESTTGELSYDVAAADLRGCGHDVCAMTRSCASRSSSMWPVSTTWITAASSGARFRRRAAASVARANRNGFGGAHEGPRFAVIYQLLSITHNERLTLRAYCADNEDPSIDTLVGVHAGANWFEREAFDLFGIVFNGHPDLRRILTDYGFIGHPFRKDFPLVGNVEVRYDNEKQRVVYEPVEIVPRTLVPRVIRDDARYEPELKGRS